MRVLNQIKTFPAFAFCQETIWQSDSIDIRIPPGSVANSFEENYNIWKFILTSKSFLKFWRQKNKSNSKLDMSWEWNWDKILSIQSVGEWVLWVLWQHQIWEWVLWNIKAKLQRAPHFLQYLTIHFDRIFKPVSERVDNVQHQIWEWVLWNIKASKGLHISCNIWQFI